LRPLLLPAQDLPARRGDEAFRSLVTELSETGGRFPGQYMSNEDSALFAVPDLETRVPAGGVYIGVGSEQNFSYIAATRPRLAFVVDIRRDNMLQRLISTASTSDNGAGPGRSPERCLHKTCLHQ